MYNAPSFPSPMQALQNGEGFEAKSANTATSRKAIDLLVALQSGFHCPTAIERREILIGFAIKGLALPGACYDLVRLDGALSLDRESVSANLELLTLFEVKSTNRSTLKGDLKGYFFNLTAAEMMAAQTLGPRYRFAFVNVVTQTVIEMSYGDVLSKARAVYPAWHIRF